MTVARHDNPVLSEQLGDLKLNLTVHSCSCQPGVSTDVTIQFPLLINVFFNEAKPEQGWGSMARPGLGVHRSAVAVMSFPLRTPSFAPTQTPSLFSLLKSSL